MASRVTKLFLQNCLEARASASSVGKKKKASGNGLKNWKLTTGASKVKVQAKPSTNNRRKNSKNKGKSNVRFLEAAQQEQKQSDKTKENLRKLKTRTNDKSKRLMAKVCPQIPMCVQEAERVLIASSVYANV